MGKAEKCGAYSERLSDFKAPPEKDELKMNDSNQDGSPL
jgi:hypothetical protein